MSWLDMAVCDIHGRACTCTEDRGQFGYPEPDDFDDAFADRAEDAMIAGWDEGLSR